MKIIKFFRVTLSANILLLTVFAFLPILIIKPDFELMQALLQYINKD